MKDLIHSSWNNLILLSDSVILEEQILYPTNYYSKFTKEEFFSSTHSPLVVF